MLCPRFALSRLALALLALSSTSLAPAGTVTWVGPDGGRWDQAANWSSGVVPTALDDVQLGSASVLVTAAEAFARSITSSGEFGGRFGTPAITLVTGGQFNRLNLVGGAHLTHNGLVTATGTSVLSGTLSGRGTTRFEGETQVSNTLLALNGGHRLELAGQTSFGNSLTLNLENGSVLVQTGDLHHTIGTSPSLYLGGNIENQGRWTVSGGELTLLTRAFANSGTLTLDAATVTWGSLGGVGVLTNTGELTLSRGSSFESVITSSGTIGGAGSIGGVINAGLLAAGGTGEIGTLNITGNLLQQTGSRVQLELGTAGSDLLAVGGSATLGGTLSLNVLSGQRVARGSQFTVMSWGSRAPGSEFANLDFSQASGYRFATAYEANGLSVTVTGVPFNWTGAAAGGFWDVANNWNSGNDGLPQAGDTVLLSSANTVIRSTRSMAAATVNGTGTLTINSGASLSLSDSASLGGLHHSGTLNNTGRVVVTGASILSGATLSGAGTTRYEGALAIQGNASALQNGQTLEVAGATTVQGSTATGLSASNGARIVNQGTWVDVASANSRLSGNSGSSAFDNQGSFTKASATTTTIGSFGLSFNNSGSVNVDAGTLSLVGNGASTGQIRIASGATLDFAGSGASFDLNRDVSNAGSFQVRAGVVNAAQGLALGGSTVISAGRLNLGGNSQFDTFNFVGSGRLDSNATLIVTGPTTWGGSTFAGMGTTRLEGAVSLVGASSSALSGGTLVMAGTTTQTSSAGINMNGGASARLVNEGTWLDQAAGNISIGGSASRFDNSGRYIKTGTFTTSIGSFGTVFNNTGTVDVQAGTLDLFGGGNSPGQFTVAAGATLQFSAGTMALGRSVRNLGSFRVGGAAIVNAAQGLELGGSTVISAGRLNLGGNSQFDTFNFVGSGRLDSNATLIVTGPTTWAGGTFAGTGTTRLEGAVSLEGAFSSALSGGTLVMAGTTTQTSSAGINMNGGASARLVNEGTWLDQAGGNISIGGSASRFDNSGRYIKTSAFTTSIGSFGTVFNNTGTVDVQAGKLQVSTGFSNTGLITLAAGAELHGTVGAFTNAGTLSGDGTVRAADRLTNTGTLAAGGLNDAGTLSLIGGLTQQANGIFLVDLGGTTAGSFDLLTISSVATLGGTLAVNLLDGAHFSVGDSFTVMTWGQRLNNSQFANLDLSHAQGYTFATEYGANSLTLRVMTAAPVPEPGSWALMAAGLVGLGALQRRRRKVQPTA